MKNIKYYTSCGAIRHHETENTCALGIPIIQRTVISGSTDVVSYTIEPQYYIEKKKNNLKIILYDVYLIEN